MLPALALALAAAVAGDLQGSDRVQIEVRVVGQGRVEMPGGRICRANSSCSQPVRKGTRVRLRVVHERGDGRFAGWDGVCRRVRGPECVVTVRYGARVFAKFE